MLSACVCLYYFISLLASHDPNTETSPPLPSFCAVPAYASRSPFWLLACPSSSSPFFFLPYLCCQNQPAFRSCLLTLSPPLPSFALTQPKHAAMP